MSLKIWQWHRLGYTKDMREMFVPNKSFETSFKKNKFLINIGKKYVKMLQQPVVTLVQFIRDELLSDGGRYFERRMLSIILRVRWQQHLCTGKKLPVFFCKNPDLHKMFVKYCT